MNVFGILCTSAGAQNFAEGLGHTEEATLGA